MTAHQEAGTPLTDAKIAALLANDSTAPFGDSMVEHARILERDLTAARDALEAKEQECEKKIEWINRLGDEVDTARAILAQFDDSDGFITEPLIDIARATLRAIEAATTRAATAEAALAEAQVCITKYGDAGALTALRDANQRAEAADAALAGSQFEATNLRLANEEARKTIDRLSSRIGELQPNNCQGSSAPPSSGSPAEGAS